MSVVCVCVWCECVLCVCVVCVCGMCCVSVMRYGVCVCVCWENNSWSLLRLTDTVH